MNGPTATTMSFEALYTTEYPRLYRSPVFLVSSSQDAEDLAQEVFLKAWHAWPSELPGSSYRHKSSACSGVGQPEPGLLSSRRRRAALVRPSSAG